MTLKAGGHSSEETNVHEKSDQVLLVMEGQVHAEIGKEKRTLRAGDVCLIPAGTPHQIGRAHV